MLEKTLDQLYEFDELYESRNSKPRRFSRLRNYLVSIQIILSSFLPIGYEKAIADTPTIHSETTPSQNGDVNGDGKINISDPVYLLRYLFADGSPPVQIKPLPGLPVTGQTKCYDNEKEIPCPKPGEPFYGQDGNYQAGIPRNYEIVKPNPEDKSTWYTIDHVTGLMWQYAGDSKKRTWNDALKYCESLELGGFSDWRMPNITQLHSIYDYGLRGFNDKSFSGTESAYWSSTSYTDIYKIILQFGDARIYLTHLIEKWNKAHVRAVRNIQVQNGDVNGDEKTDIDDATNLLEYLFLSGPKPFQLNRHKLPETGDTYQDYQIGVPRNYEIVKPNPEDKSTWYTIDHVTGLMWQYAGDSKKRTWNDALKYCESLELGGFSDWRMPNIRELQSIVEYKLCCLYPKFNTEHFDEDSFRPEGLDYYEFWSSTPHYTIDFFSVFVMDAVSHDDHWVRAVRTIQLEDLKR